MYICNWLTLNKLMITIMMNYYCKALYFRCLWGPGYASPIQYPTGICLLEVNDRNTRTRCEICSRSTIKTPERSLRRGCVVFIVNFEHTSHFVLAFLLNM